MARPRKIATVVDDNDRRGTLVALRRKLASLLDDCASARDAPALARQIREIDTELASLPVPEEDKVAALMRDD